MRATHRCDRGRHCSRSGLLLTHWRGELELSMATLIPCSLMLVLWWLLTFVFDSVDWVWNRQVAAISSFMLIVLLLCTAVWGLVGVGRSAKRADDRGEGLVRVHGAVSLVMACALGTAGEFGVSTTVWLSSLKAIAFDEEPRAEVFVDPRSARLVVRGAFALGTTKRVKALLEDSPVIRIVELDSPGGVAVEGLALAELFAARGLDTLVMRRCSSACVSAFAAGERRFLGPSGRLGLHAAGAALRSSGKDVDTEHARLLQRRGVAQWLIEAERATPTSDILVPGPATLLGSGLVTDLWREGS